MFPSALHDRSPRGIRWSRPWAVLLLGTVTACSAASASNPPSSAPAAGDTVAGRGADVQPSAGRFAEPVPREVSPAIVELEQAFKAAATQIGPAVVSITSARPMEGDMPSFLRPFAPPDGEMKGIGSGVIIDHDGHILTNNHVVDGAATLLVQLHDDREYEADVVGTDPESDLAVIRIEAPRLEPAVLADSDDIRVGQWVMAAGSPFGLPRTITAGIVSATGRGSMGIAEYGDFIQTDAAVNQGNSGGPLIDLTGRVIGINTAIASSGGGSNGIGFAIPINLARSVVDQLIEHGAVARGWLGIVMGKLTPELSRSFAFAGEGGILINDVDPKGPAAKSGVKVGDIVTRLDKKPIRDMAAFRNAIAQARPGSAVELEIWRAGANTTLAVRLGNRDDGPVTGASPPKTRPSPKKSPASGKKPTPLGLRLAEPEAQLRSRLGIDAGIGALVSDIARGSVADGADLRRGDVLLSVDGKVVRSAAQAVRWLEKADLDAGVRIRVQRGRFGHFTVLHR